MQSKETCTKSYGYKILASNFDTKTFAINTVDQWIRPVNSVQVPAKNLYKKKLCERNQVKHEFLDCVSSAQEK